MMVAESAYAQDYPNRPITLVVPYAAGGGNDLFARIASEKMSRTLGQQATRWSSAAPARSLSIRRSTRMSATIRARTSRRSD
jgi:putative tricarboxylic transport membrane protein